MNVAAVFGGEAAGEDDEEDADDTTDSGLVVAAGHSDHAEPRAAAGTVEEEEIEEEEADLAHYVDALEEDNIFEELEEEIAYFRRARTGDAGDCCLRGTCAGRCRAVLFGAGFFGRD